MGFYPPKGENETKITNAASQADPDPPFVVRDKKAILQDLGKSSLPLDFTAIPIMNNFIERFAIYNDRCPFATKKKNEILSDPDTFTD